MPNSQNERCPLSAREFGIPKIAVDDIPNFCMSRCEPLWSIAISSGSKDGEYDVYNPNPHTDEWSPCDHVDTEIGYSHEGLQSIDSSSLRLYSIVDICFGEDCGEEYGEQVFKFDCPNN